MKIQTKLGADPKKQIQPTSNRLEWQLTLILLLLRLEGGVCSDSRLLQLKDDGILLLAGLPQVLVGHTFLDQLAGQPRDLLISELDGGLRRLKRSALPLKMALHFLSGRTFALEGGSSIVLLVLKDLLANFILTCTLEDRRIAWLCLVESHLASLHD
jgi:hypothetical protein